MQNLTFKIEFKNVPDSMLTAMAHLEIGDITSTSVNFKSTLHLEIFTEICALIKVANIEKDIKEIVSGALTKAADNKEIY